MIIDIYKFKNYKKYLVERVGSKGVRSGTKGKMAQAMGCHAGYLSQILHGRADLSLEQAQKISPILGHTDEESHFFLLLVQLERAGNTDLKGYFQKQIDEILNKRMVLNQRLKIENELSDEDKTIYYSSWLYSAIHIAITIPELQTATALATHFNLNLSKTNEIISFLERISLLKREGELLKITNNNIMLEKKSPHIFKHHTNWKLRTIDSLEYEEIDELHYSGVITLSNEDALKIKDILIKSLGSSLDLVKDSPEEELRCISMDFFRV